MAKLVRVRLLVSFGGKLAGYDSPPAGTILEVEPELAKALVEEPAGNPRAEYLEDDVVAAVDTAIETAEEKPPENAARRTRTKG
jgi:hypothetical protein